MSSIYSVLIYEREINGKTYENIVGYIKKGIKVYYLTESYEEDFMRGLAETQIEILVQFINNYLLSLNYYICLSMQVGNNFIFEDGNIPEEIKKEIQQENFNFEQYDIEHLNKDSHIIVKAGAGTGKTKTMIDRSMFLRHKGYSSFRNMAMITFTNKSAMQMKAKLSERLEAYYNITHDYKYLDWIDELSDMRVQTIHSFSKGFIEQFGDIIKIDRKSKIKSLKYEKYKILEELINEYRFAYFENYKEYRYIPQYKLIKAILKIENHLISRGIDIIGNENKLILGTVISIDKEKDNKFSHLLDYLLSNLCKRIKVFKEKNSFIELNDLVANLRQFVDIEGITNEVNIKYIMVDEFQDTDTIQVQFIIWLIKNFGCKSFIVGDIKQSIYRFRGADYTAFRQFEDELESQNINSTIEKRRLKKNYRSDKKIIESLNEFFSNIANISNTEETKYFTFNGDDRLEGVIENSFSNDIINYFSKDENSIKDEIVEYILRLVEKNNIHNDNLRHGENQEEIVVLVRSNKDLEDIVNRIEEKGIVCKKEISGGFYRSVAVREFYVMLKALLYPKVYINQYAFINSSYGFGIDNDMIFDNFDVDSNYMKKIIENNEEYNKLKQYKEKLMREPFMIVLREITKDFEPHINYGIKKLRERIDIKNEEEAIKKIRTNSTNYEMNIMHLFTILDRNFSNTEASILDVEEFLQRMIQTENTEDEKMLSFDNGKYDLTCMTVHKAKGLEFDHVVIPKTNNGFLHNNKDVNIFLNINNNGEIKVGYSVKLEDVFIKNDIYTDNINEENKEIIAEEIRLLYVAVTRAKKSIHLNKSKLVNNSGKIHNWMELLERGNLKHE